MYLRQPRWLGRAFYALPVETLTFLFTDIEGSTALLRRLGDDVYAQVLADHHALIRSGLAAHEGQEVACLAADLADWHRAAELHGIAQAFIERVGQPWQEPEAGYRRDSLHTVRISLGEEQFERAYAKGMALSLDQALDLALAKAGPA